MLLQVHWDADMCRQCLGMSSQAAAQAGCNYTARLIMPLHWLATWGPTAVVHRQPIEVLTGSEQNSSLGRDSSRAPVFSSQRAPSSVRPCTYAPSLAGASTWHTQHGQLWMLFLLVTCSPAGIAGPLLSNNWLCKHGLHSISGRDAGRMQVCAWQALHIA